MKEYISWDDFDNMVDELADMIPEGVYEGVYAVPRGGLITGVMSVSYTHLTLPTNREV